MECSGFSISFYRLTLCVDVCTMPPIAVGVALDRTILIHPRRLICERRTKIAMTLRLRLRREKFLCVVGNYRVAQTTPRKSLFYAAQRKHSCKCNTKFSFHSFIIFICISYFKFSFKSTAIRYAARAKQLIWNSSCAWITGWRKFPPFASKTPYTFLVY